MTLDKNISIGNIVSWVVIIVGMAIGYSKLDSATSQNAKDVKAATELAERVDRSQRDLDLSRQAQINALTVDVAVLKITASNIDKKLDELVTKSRQTKSQ